MGHGNAAAKIEKYNARIIIAAGVMRRSVWFVSFLIVCLRSAAPIQAHVNVTQEHNSLSRDGVYIDRAFTRTNAAALTRDLNFDGTISGNVYAQPLYIEGGPNGPMIIAVTDRTMFML